MNFNPEILGTRIRLARLQKGWTQYKLRHAAQLGGSSQVADIESGKRPDVSLAVIIRIAEALEMSFDELVGELEAAGVA